VGKGGRWRESCGGGGVTTLDTAKLEDFQVVFSGGFLAGDIFFIIF
jgi:hypothetical protein